MRFGLSAATLLIVMLFVFAPAIGYGFVFEDTKDARLTLDPAFTGHQIYMQPYRALTYASRWIDMTLFGIQPWGFHLGSIAWHAVNVWLVFALAWLVLPPWGAIAAAGIFAWHPIQIEAVAYVSARADMVACAGLLLALLAASIGSVAGAVVGVVFACLGKEASLVAWALVPLWAAWTRAPFPLMRWCAVGGVLGGIAYAAILRDITEFSIQPSMALAGEQLAVIFRLLSLVAVPWGFTIDHDWASIAWLGPGALVGALGLTFWAVTEGWAHRHWLAFAWLWTLVALSPRLVVPLYEGLHEHHMYGIVIGWCLCAGHWLTVNTRKRMHYATP